MKNEEPRSYFTGRPIESMTPTEIDEEIKALRAVLLFATVGCTIVIPLIIATGLFLYFLKP